MMTLENAIRTLDEVIPPHTHRTVDREHMPIALAWEAVKNELENRVPVVRCEDCKHHEDEQPGMVWCPYNWEHDVFLEIAPRLCWDCEDDCPGELSCAKLAEHIVEEKEAARDEQ